MEKEKSKADMADKIQDKIQEAIEKGIPTGEFIRQEMIKPSGQRQDFIAEKIKVLPTSLSYVLTGKTSLSPGMAAKLSHHFQTYTTQQLLTLQAAQDAKKADQAYVGNLAKEDPSPL